MRWLADDWTRERANALEPLLASHHEGRVRALVAWNKIDVYHRAWMIQTLQMGRVPLMSYPAFIVPVLSEKACARLIEWSREQSWEENEGEEDAYRMPEIVLSERDEQFYDFMRQVLLHGLGPWVMAAFGVLPAEFSSIQMTKYNPVERSGGNLHVDQDSEYTAVISLNTGEFVGGGTELCDGRLGSQIVPPVPTGHALIFPGRHVLHKGLHVESGERMLLTVWSR